jgi:transcriptional regulator with XRE-family HTH domain
MLNVTIEAVQKAAAQTTAARFALEKKEQKLQQVVAGFLSAQSGSARDMAKSIGFTVQYICDIRNGRRKVSLEFLKRLEDYARG